MTDIPPKPRSGIFDATFGSHPDGMKGWTILALMIDGHTRELLGWRLSRSGKASTAGSALEHAPIARFGEDGTCPGALPAAFG